MKLIAVLAAMGMEEAKLSGRMESRTKTTVGGLAFTCGTIGGAKIYLYRCGWGMRNAEYASRAVIKALQPDLLILYGVSGGMIEDIHIGDIVVATSYFSASEQQGAAVATDKAPVELAEKVLPFALFAPLATSKGLMLNKKQKARVVAESGAVCIDMESYAVAKTARTLGTSLLVIRCISDTLQLKSLLSFFKNGNIAANKAAEATEAVIKALANEGSTV